MKDKVELHKQASSLAVKDHTVTLDKHDPTTQSIGDV